MPKSWICIFKQNKNALVINFGDIIHNTLTSVLICIHNLHL